MRAFLGALGFVYFVAFAGLIGQIVGLVGHDGILPADALLERVREALPGPGRFRLLPTLFWLWPTDGMLRGLAIAGALLGAVATVWVAPAWLYAALWLLYLSLFSVGGDFLHFQWDTLLLETGFLAIFAAPLRWRPAWAAAVDSPRLVRWLLWWLLFRLMFASGAVKLLSGDSTWWDLSALTIHYETQPLPSWIAWWAHQLPRPFHVASCAVMFAIELGAPFLIFLGARARLVAAALLALLQVAIAVSGNYAFFNLLTLALILPLIGDRLWPFASNAPAVVGRPWPQAVVVPLAIFLIVMSSADLLAQLRLAITPYSVLTPLRRALGPFELTNAYGLFAVMTTVRPEIEIEGSDDGETWKAYRFGWKPGPPDAPPRIVAPYQPRLDWQMWFAALGDVRDSPWFTGLVRGLLEGSPEVVDLFAENPFPERPPRFLFARRYRYRFSSWAERRESDDWWVREETGIFFHPVSLDDFRKSSDTAG